jgi:hypothetical protein
MLSDYVLAVHSDMFRNNTWFWLDDSKTVQYWGNTIGNWIVTGARQAVAIPNDTPLYILYSPTETEDSMLDTQQVKFWKRL